MCEIKVESRGEVAHIVVNGREFMEFISEERIRKRVKELAKEIDEVLREEAYTEDDDARPLFVMILNGAFIFAADLVREIETEIEVTSTRLKSYDGTKSTGKIKTLQPLEEDIAGRTVVVVEDIVDSGATIERITNQLYDLGARKVLTAVLLFKEEACKIPDLHLDFVAFKIPDAFVVGYGLDYDEAGREKRSILKLAEGSR